MENMYVNYFLSHTKPAITKDNSVERRYEYVTIL